MEFDREKDSALRNAFAQLGVRVAPEAKTSEMVTQLKEQFQIEACVDAGVLTLRQNGAIISTGTALRAFTEKAPQHFVLAGGLVRSAADLRDAGTPEGTRQRVELIKARGLKGFTDVIAAPQLRPGVVASREMSKADWMNLTTHEKVEALKADQQIAAIVMAKRK
jgi:hypothetical protein